MANNHSLHELLDLLDEVRYDLLLLKAELVLNSDLNFTVIDERHDGGREKISNDTEKER